MNRSTTENWPGTLRGDAKLPEQPLPPPLAPLVDPEPFRSRFLITTSAGSRPFQVYCGSSASSYLEGSSMGKPESRSRSLRMRRRSHGASGKTSSRIPGLGRDARMVIGGIAEPHSTDSGLRTRWRNMVVFGMVMRGNWRRGHVKMTTTAARSGARRLGTNLHDNFDRYLR